jgi:nicotinate-nucleotide pyrophosphorylase (carboxylating)
VHGVGISRPAFLGGPALAAPGPAEVAADVAAALAEDVGAGDVTAQLLPETLRVRGRIVTREDAVLCGAAWAEATFRTLDPETRLEWQTQDGAAIRAGQVLVEIEGAARALLSAERTALNFLQTLSGTATAASRFAAAAQGTGCMILDTRKTVPGLRRAQKYAVRCGGAHNHRMGLFDMFLIKENHIAAAGSLAAAVAAARRHSASLAVEVEVESLEELERAFDAEPDVIMLDDFTAADRAEAVARNRARRRAVKLEASGGISLANVREIAQSGVDYISIGALTKHVRAIDLSLRIDWAEFDRTGSS